jgi:hypothetical protein
MPQIQSDQFNWGSVPPNTIPPTAFSGTIGGGGGGSGSTFAGVVIPFGFEVISDTFVSSGNKSKHYIGNSGYFVGWSISTVGSGVASISVSKTQPNGTVVNMIGTGNAPYVSGVFASGTNFVGWSSTGVVLGDIINLGVSNISGQISELTFNLLNRNI